MAEELISRKFETKERVEEAKTDYLKKHGVKSVGHREVFKVEETETGIEVCGGSVTRYYFDNKEPHDLPGGSACVSFPKEFLPQLNAMIEKIIAAKK